MTDMKYSKDPIDRHLYKSAVDHEMNKINFENAGGRYEPNSPYYEKYLESCKILDDYAEKFGGEVVKTDVNKADICGLYEIKVDFINLFNEEKESLRELLD